MAKTFPFAWVGTVLLGGLLLVPSVSFAQTAIPPLFCPVDGILQKTCDKDGDADPAKGIPAAYTTKCEYPDLDTRKTTCVTTFEDGARQECTRIGLPIGNNLFTCTNIAAGGGETGETKQRSALDQVASAATNVTGNALTGLGEAILYAVSAFILTLSGFLLGIVGVFFNWMVIRTVFQFGTYFGTSESMLIAWGVIRDIANIGLLFGFIFMGVLLILNVEGGGHGHGGGISARKAIPRLIIFAVLLNFSLFASQAVVDVSNAFSAQFAGLAGMQCDSQAGDQTRDQCANEGIAGKVMQMAGIATIWDKNVNPDGVILLGLAIFVTITTIVLLAAGIMLLIRVVVLTLLMITSPIGFAGMVIPGLGGLAKQWWHMLLSQSFFAPVMLLLMFISLKMAEGLNPKGISLVSAFTGGNAGNASNLAVLVVFAVVIGLMLASLMAASKMGAMGAKFATNSASGLVFGAMTKGAGLTVGAGAYAARLGMQRGGTQLLGKVGGRIGGLAGLKGAELGQKWGEGAGKVLVNRGLDPLSKATLDPRRVPGMGALLGAAGIVEGAKPSEHGGFTDMQHQFADFRDSKRSKELEQQYQGQIKTRNLEKNGHGDGSSMTDTDREFLASLSTKDLEALHGIKDALNAKGLAQNLTPSQFSKLMDSDNLTDTEKGNLKTARFEALQVAADAAVAAATAAGVPVGSDKAVKALLKGLSKQDKENLPSSLLKNKSVLKSLSDSDRKSLVESEKRSRSDREEVKGSYAHEEIKTMFKKTVEEVTDRETRAGRSATDAAAIAGAEAAAKVLAGGGLMNLNNEQVAELDADILLQPTIAFTLTPQMLKQLQKSKDLKPVEMKQIGTRLNMAAPGMSKYMNSVEGSFWK